MTITADPCLTEGLGRDVVTGQVGARALRHINWPYAAALGTATGLKLDATGDPYVDPIDGFVQNGTSITGRAVATDPGTGGVSMLIGGQAYISLPLTNTLHRPALCWIISVYDWRANVTLQGSFSASDTRFIGCATTAAVNTLPADPALNADTNQSAVPFGGIVTAGFGGASSVGGRWHNSVPFQWLNPGETLNVKSTVAYNRGGLGFTVGTYDNTILFAHYVWLMAWAQPPT